MNTPLFSSQNPIRVFVLFSGKATAIQYLQRLAIWYNHLYRIVGAVSTSKKAPGIAFFKKHTNNADNIQHKGRAPHAKESIPCEILDWNAFQNKHPEDKREEYFKKLLEILERYDFDIIVCSGFHLRIPDFFIQHIFPRKIINTRPADLSVVNEITGKRLFVGIWHKAIQATLDAGKKDSCSTAHYITAGYDIDGGEIIAQSQRFKLIPSDTPEDVQLRISRIGSDGQALEYALRIICNETVPCITIQQKIKRFFKAMLS